MPNVKPDKAHKKRLQRSKTRHDSWLYKAQTATEIAIIVLLPGGKLVKTARIAQVGVEYAIEHALFGN